MSNKRGSKAQKVIIGGALIVLGYVTVYTVISIVNSIISKI
ncbi:hypothetical protein [Bacillus taeanensis]|nr:hypothetical protein [Bacillus taeanensis]